MHSTEGPMRAFLADVVAAAADGEGAAVALPPFAPETRKLFVEMPYTVNYAARCHAAVPYTHPDSAKLQVLSSLLTTKFLHREIREKGGAYGGGATYSGNMFRFYSYRDPGADTTLAAFDRSVEWAAAGSFADGDVDEAKLLLFQGVDAPVPPSQRGMSIFTTGITYDMQQTKFVWGGVFF